MCLRGRVSRNVVWICLIAAAAATWLVTFKQFEMASLMPELEMSFKQRKLADNDALRLDLPHCRVPHVPIASKVYAEAAKRDPIMMSPDFDKCDAYRDFSRIENDILYLTDPALGECCHTEFRRPYVMIPDVYQMKVDCLKIQGKQLNVSQMEFLKVTCVAKDSPAEKFINFHSNVRVKGTILRKQKYWESSASSSRVRPPSIFVLVLDSTTRGEAYRSLPKTMDFLVSQLGFVDFRGHHPMAEPTMVNALAMLMGLKPKEFWGKFKKTREDFWDSVPFIWNVFDELDYITGYFEDMAIAGTFNYGGQKGFVHRPTDLNLRALSIAHDTVYPFNRKNMCYGKRNAVRYFLDYILQAMTKLRNSPTFLINWPCWPQHEFPSAIRTQDENYLRFFEQVSRDTELLDNTFFMVLSDHGFYRGAFSRSHPGLLERRNLPLLLRLPTRLRQKYPGMIHNVLSNSEVITGHFDVYRTLLHLARMAEDGNPIVNGNEKHGQSLLTKLRANRSCKDAGIPKTMCSCNLPPPPVNNLSSSLNPDFKTYPQLLINNKEPALH